MPSVPITASPADAAMGAGRLWESSVGGDMAFLLARANAVSLSRANAALTEHGLKVRSYSVLALAASGARPSQRELSEFLRLDPSQIVALIDELETRGLAQREPDPSDRRANVVVITDLGREVYDAARRSTVATEQAAFAELTADDRDRLTGLLRRLAGAPDTQV